MNKKPIEVWRGVGDWTGWTWNVMSKNRFKDEKPNQYARWFCLVTNNIVGPDGEYGDVYREEIKARARKESA